VIIRFGMTHKEFLLQLFSSLDILFYIAASDATTTTINDHAKITERHHQRIGRQIAFITSPNKLNNI
jgi:hypothetical protein